MTYQMDFVARVLRAFEHYDQQDDLFWRTGARYGGGEYAVPASFFAKCSDVFYWGCADLEEVAPENVGVLEQAFADCKAAHDLYGTISGAALFVARVRKIRPQGAAYPKEPELWPLFDACGPAREVGPGNPYPHPGERPLPA